jgi:integral membrane protein
VSNAPSKSGGVTAGAVLRYRVMAYATGVLLVVLVFVAMPMKYIGDDDSLVGVVGVIHGWLYLAYVITALQLALQARWAIGKTVLVALAGTVPLASFFAERKVVRDLAAASSGPGQRAAAPTA